MADRIVDIIHVEKDGVELKTVQEITVTMTDTKTPVKTMNRKRRAIGYQRGIPEFTFDLSCVWQVGTKEVDWEKVMLNNETFGITYEESDAEVAGTGKRYALVECKISEIGKPANVDGTIVYSVKGTALDHKAEK